MRGCGAWFAARIEGPGRGARAMSSPRLRVAARRLGGDCRARPGVTAARGIRARPACPALRRVERRAADTGAGARSSCRIHHARDRGYEIGPLRMLLLQSPPAGGGELVILRAAVVLGRFPLGGDPALELEALQGGIEGAEFDIQSVARDGANGFGDTVAMKRSEEEGLQDQHVEGSLKEIHMETVYMKS